MRTTYLAVISFPGRKSNYSKQQQEGWQEQRKPWKSQEAAFLLSSGSDTTADGGFYSYYEKWRLRCGWNGSARVLALRTHCGSSHSQVYNFSWMLPPPFFFAWKVQYYQNSVIYLFLKFVLAFCMYDIHKSWRVKIRGFLFLFQEIEQQHLGYASL